MPLVYAWTASLLACLKTSIFMTICPLRYICYDMSIAEGQRPIKNCPYRTLKLNNKIFRLPLSPYTTDRV
jgi:hypothetical protein